MNKQKNEVKKDEVVLELNFTITSKTYRFSLVARKAWLVGFVLLLVRLIAIMINGAS